MNGPCGRDLKEKEADKPLIAGRSVVDGSTPSFSPINLSDDKQLCYAVNVAPIITIY
jgi:hypothetical protein